MRFTDQVDEGLEPPFNTVQMPEHGVLFGAGGPDDSYLSNSAYFDLTTGAIKTYSMRHAVSALKSRPLITKGGLAPGHLRRVKAILGGNVRHNVPLQCLADLCGLSVYHFLREFKQSTGLTPHQWAIVLSVSNAADLLADTTLTVTQVAQACGFSDVSHLSRWFKKIIGQSPKAWQLRHGAARAAVRRKR